MARHSDPTDHGPVTVRTWNGRTYVRASDPTNATWAREFRAWQLAYQAHEDVPMLLPYGHIVFDGGAWFVETPDAWLSRIGWPKG